MEPVSSTALEVSWEAPDESCPTNVKYNVEYRLTNIGQCQPSDINEGMMLSVTGTTTTLTDLHPYSSYEIQMTASVSVGTLYAVTEEAGRLPLITLTLTTL